MMIYPNPASDYLNLKLKDQVKITSVGLTDITGRLVKSLKNITDAEITIELQDLPNGMYYLQLANEKGITAIRKVIVER
jgi:hypothetical protein